MDKRLAADDASIRYLLGEMTEAEKVSLESGIVADDEAFEKIGAAEDELIDEYLSEGLTAEERNRFEKIYLNSPERRERVKFARALGQRLTEKPKTASVIALPTRTGVSPTRWLAAAAVLLAVVGAYFAWTSIQLREEIRLVEDKSGNLVRGGEDLVGQIAQIRSEAEQLRRELQRQRVETNQLAEQLARLQSHAAKAVSFVLAAGRLRDGGNLQALRIPAGTEIVRLTLPISDPSYVSYRAVIETPEGKTVWKGDAARSEPGAKTLLVTLPARALASGDYILSVTGVSASGRSESTADFSFRIKKG